MHKCKCKLLAFTTHAKMSIQNKPGAFFDALNNARVVEERWLSLLTLFFRLGPLHRQVFPQRLDLIREGTACLQIHKRRMNFKRDLFWHQMHLSTHRWVSSCMYVHIHIHIHECCISFCQKVQMPKMTCQQSKQKVVPKDYISCDTSWKHFIYKCLCW